MRHAKKHQLGIAFRPLDAPCASARALTPHSLCLSQLGHIMLLRDKRNNAAIIDCSSNKRSCITRSALAAEAHAFSTSFDSARALQPNLLPALNRKAPAQMLTSLKLLFDTITRLTGMAEKRVLIDIFTLRQSCKKSEMSNIAHVLSAANLADPLTKRARSDLLISFLHTGKFTPAVNQWMMRTVANSAEQQRWGSNCLTKQRAA